MRLYSEGVPWGDILPRYAFLEPLISDRRVLEIGCGDGRGARFLLERGAAQVLGIDREGSALQAAVAGGPVENLSYKAYDGSRVDAPSATFDVVMAFGLGLRMDPGLLSEIERVLTPAGILVTALRKTGFRSLGDLGRAPEAEGGLSFERFVAGLQDRFPRVSVVAQSPFLGFSIGWMGADAEDLPLEMDTGFVPDGAEDVAYYLAICGREAVSFESQSLVQLPYASTMEELASARGRASEGKAESQELRIRLEEQARLGRKTEEIRDGLKDRVGRLEERLADADRRSEGLRQELVRKERLVERLRADLSQREQEELLLRKETVNRLIGRDGGEPVSEGDIPRLLREVAQEREHLAAEREQLRGENDRLVREMEVQADELERIRSELALGRQGIVDLRERADRNAAEAEEKSTWLDASRSEVERLEAKVASLQRDLEQGRKERDGLIREKRERARSRTDLDVLVSSLREENRGLKSALERMGQKADDDRRQRISLESEINQLQAALKSRREEMEEMDAQTLALRLENDQKTIESERLTARNGELLSRLETVNGVVQSLQGQQVEAVRETDRLRAMLSELDGRGLASSEEVDTLRAEVADREEELRSLRQQLSTETGKRAKAEEQLRDQARLTRDLESDLVALVNRLEEGEERDHDLRKASGELKRNLERQGLDLEDAREKISDLTRELFAARQHEEELTAALDLMREAVVEQEQARAALEVELGNLRLADSESVRDLEKSLDATQVELTLTRRRNDELNELRAQSEAAHEHQRSVNSHQKREMERVQSRLAEIQDRLAKAEAAAQQTIDLERDLAWHRDELERLRGALHLRQEELDESSRELEQLQAELAQANEELKGLRQQKTKLVIERAEVEDLSTRLDRERSALEEKLDSVLSQTDELERQLQEREGALRAFESQVDERDRDLADQKRRLENHQSKERQLNEELGRLSREFEEKEIPVREELELAVERERVLQARLATMQQQLAEFESRTGLELSSMGEQIRRREEQMQSLTERLTEMDEKRSWWEARADEIDQKRRSLEEDLSRERTRLEGELGELKQEREREAARLEQEIRAGRDLLASREAEAQAVESRAAELENQLAGMHQRAEQEQQINKSRLAEAEAQAQMAEEQRGRLEAQLAALQGQQIAQANQVADLQGRLEQAERRRQMLESQDSQGRPDANQAAAVARLEAEVNGARRRIAELEAEISRAREERRQVEEALRREVGQLKSEMERHASVAAEGGGPASG